MTTGPAIWVGDWQLKIIKGILCLGTRQQQQPATWNDSIFVTRVHAHSKGPFKQEHDWNS